MVYGSELATCAIQAATEQDDVNALLQASGKQFPSNEISESYRIYATAIKQYSLMVSDYIDLWNMLGPCYYIHECRGGCRPSYVLDKADHDMRQKIADVQGSREKLVQLATSQAVDEVDKRHNWRVAKDIIEIKPHVTYKPLLYPDGIPINHWLGPMPPRQN